MNTFDPFVPGDKPTEEGLRLDRFLARAGRGMGLTLCLHSRHARCILPERRRTHRAPYCLRIKDSHSERCVAFDLVETHRALRAEPDGRIQTCPFGVTEIVMPVLADGLWAGALFAGPCWRGESCPTGSGLIPVRGRQWLEDRRALLRAVAREVGFMLGAAAVGDRDSRRERIADWLRKHAAEPAPAASLARHLSLSPSRARHAVRELFGCSVGALIREARMREAAHILRTTPLPIGEVAWRVGYADQNYFTRVFTGLFRISPRVWRRRHALEP